MVETIIQKMTTSQLHTASPHADIDKDLFAEPPEEPKLWILHIALCAIRKAPKLWHQHVMTLVESMNFSLLLTDPRCFSYMLNWTSICSCMLMVDCCVARALKNSMVA